VWPFGRKSASSPAPGPVIADQLEARPASEPPVPGAATADNIHRIEGTLESVLRTDPMALQDAIAEMSALSGRLEGMLVDFELTGQLNRFSGSVAAAYARLNNTVGGSPDIILRQMTIGQTLKWPALLAFADGMVDNMVLDQDTLRMVELYDLHAGESSPEAIHRAVQYSMMTVGHVSTESDWSKLLDELTYGSALLFVEGAPAVLVLDTVKFQARHIGRAQSEPSIKGPQEAFNEILLTHMNQLRRRIRSSWLKFDSMTVGGYTKTSVLVAHIEGLTNPELVSAIKRRVAQVKVDEVQELHQIADRILERRSTLFPMTRTTERVDWVARDLLRGKVALIVDNDPFVAVYPNTLMDFYQTTQDYVFSTWDGTLVRLVRLLGIILAVYLMPLYIALTSVNPDLVPTKLILTVAGSRQGIPFSPVMEVIIMYIIIEVLREAANRLPQQLATTLGTVGAVVVGTAIVKAGIVDDLMIVIATLSALGLFTTPSYEMTAAWRWLFWIMVVGAYAFGIFGMILVTVGIFTYLCSLENFGVPFFTPFGPTRIVDLADSWVRAPANWFVNRPTYTRPVDVSQARPTHVRGDMDLYQAQRDARQ
jgi:hypothetical protein